MNARRHDDHLPSRRIARWLEARQAALREWLCDESNRYDLLAWICMSIIFGIAAVGLHQAVIA